jgi:hypothetical protein
MASEPIVVTGEEEVPAVIARLRATHAHEVPLVVRGRSRFAQSRFSFALVRRYAAQMGKQVIVASPDPAVQQMAEASGLRSYPVSGADQRPAPGRTTSLTVATPVTEVAPSWGSSVREALAAAATQLPELPPPLERLRAGAVASRRLPTAAYALAPMLLAVGLCVLAFYGPSAKVTLLARGQPYQADVTVTASPGSGPIRVREVTTQMSQTQSFKTMGQKITKGAVATGTVTFDASNCSSHGPGYLIPNGTRLRGPNGVEFATNGGDVQIGGDNDTQVDSSIMATQPGTNGNVDPGNFTFEEQGQGSCIQISSNDPTTGGVDEQRSTAIQQSDLDSARTTLQQGLQRQIENQLSQQAQSGEKLDDSQIIFSPVSFTTDKPINDPSPTFDATLVLKAEATFYNAADVTAAFAKAAESHLPADQQIAGKVDAEYSVTAGQGGQLTFTGQAKGYRAPRINIDSVKSQVAGAPIAQAQAVLRRLPVQSVNIQQFPFGLPLMPLASSRIDLDYVVTNGPGPATS